MDQQVLVVGLHNVFLFLTQNRWQLGTLEAKLPRTQFELGVDHEVGLLHLDALLGQWTLGLHRGFGLQLSLYTVFRFFRVAGCCLICGLVGLLGGMLPTFCRLCWLGGIGYALRYSFGAALNSCFEIASWV